MEKRKASPEKETPRKKHKQGCKAKVLVDQENTTGVKRRAGADQDAPHKRRRVGSEAKDATSTLKKVSVKDTNDGTTKRKICLCIKLPKKMKMKKEPEMNQSSSSSSSSDGHPENPKVNTSRADFKAKYLQLCKIGEGGFGSVYSGLRRSDCFPVAIKHIQGPEVDLEMTLHGIPREVALMQRATSGTTDCAVVSLLDWYHLDMELIIVMERPVPSIDLRSYVYGRGGTLEEDEAKNFMAQMVEAAIDMHQRGVFHRDIKAENVLVELCSRGQRLRIIDFGCGSFKLKKSHHTYSGTFSLAPPEWDINKSYKAAPTTVWQLGAMLYRMLHTQTFRTMRYITGKIQLNNELSKDCLDFFRLCLAIFPEDRASLQQLQLHPWLKTSHPSS
ncbi:serine/threonine-protein kinase pim-1-like [Labrus mixtus]|uniref:serine/threonine-protein kinase pim-1-like n=1 Tax=Labrus mixtus TaxID=508554 RepID=UPI0029C0FBF4|nr:serine/threonine-protein kinase pim-1-like [Labrus mixtus]